MNARETFYNTQLGRFLRFCRRISGNSPESSSKRSLNNLVGQQYAEGLASSSEALPAFPTNAQIAQGGGSLLYRHRERNETEPVIVPTGRPGQDASVQVFLSPSCDMFQPAAFLPVTPARWSTQAEKPHISAQARLKSLTNGQAEIVAFFNLAPHDVVVLWLDYSGDEVLAPH